MFDKRPEHLGVKSIEFGERFGKVVAVIGSLVKDGLQPDVVG
jgi:hypothetical protein